jgi:glycosidase
MSEQSNTRNQNEIEASIKRRLEHVYGAEKAGKALTAIMALVERYGRSESPIDELFSEADAALITYGDSLKRSGQTPLSALAGFCEQHLEGVFSTVHILPFFPYSSDDGFSVKDFHAVDPALGSWDDIARLGRRFELLFDFVLNHISAQSEWFSAYLRGEPEFATLAFEQDPNADLSAVTRPRALPLLTPFEKADGSQVHLWTTFSADQVDINYADPAVLVRMLDVLCAYIERGAKTLRLDAVGFMWKEVGTSCIHHEKTHELICLMRDVLDLVAPQVLILTETNVPHAENISYFGDGQHEAQMVYNFSLPPLVLDALRRGDGALLSRWAATLDTPSDRTSFFNFTASHDGIGVRPLEGMAPAHVLEGLVELVSARGGRVSYRHMPDGSKKPYELNVTYVDALRGSEKQAGDAHFVSRVLASQAIACTVPGMPAVYIGTLLGSRNWQQGVEQTGHPRTINRQKLDLPAVERELSDPTSFRARVFAGIKKLLRARRQQPALHPNAAFDVIDLGPQLFAIMRQRAGQTLLCVQNLGASEQTISLPAPLDAASWNAVLGRQSATASLAAYGSLWLSTSDAVELPSG